jgi:hypothetical protein
MILDLALDPDIGAECSRTPRGVKWATHAVLNKKASIQNVPFPSMVK